MMQPLIYIAVLLVSWTQAATIDVDVGKNETTKQKGAGFTPSSISAQTGDKLVFTFQSGAHNVVASSFKKPCNASGGFESGVVPVSEFYELDQPGLRLPTVNVRVNSSDSLWFFDQESKACHDGAVLAVNPTDEQSLDAFMDNAMGGTGAASTTASGHAATTSTGNTATNTGVTATTSTLASATTSTSASASATETPSDENGGRGRTHNGIAFILVLLGLVSMNF